MKLSDLYLALHDEWFHRIFTPDLCLKLLNVVKVAKRGPCRHAYAKDDCDTCKAIADLGLISEFPGDGGMEWT